MTDRTTVDISLKRSLQSCCFVVCVCACDGVRESERGETGGEGEQEVERGREGGRRGDGRRKRRGREEEGKGRGGGGGERERERQDGKFNSWYNLCISVMQNTMHSFIMTPFYKG